MNQSTVPEYILEIIIQNGLKSNEVDDFLIEEVVKIYEKSKFKITPTLLEVIKTFKDYELVFNKKYLGSMGQYELKFPYRPSWKKIRDPDLKLLNEIIIEDSINLKIKEIIPIARLSHPVLEDFLLFLDNKENLYAASPEWYLCYKGYSLWESFKLLFYFEDLVKNRDEL